MWSATASSAKSAIRATSQDRLDGFGHETPRKIPLDLGDFPALPEKLNRRTGPQPFKQRACVGPIAVKDRGPLEADIANFTAALAVTEVTEGFLDAASPGVIAAFQPNEHYPSHRDYAAALAEAMKEEYEAIAAAGFLFQVDCPDLAMARHTGFPDIDKKEFIERAEIGVEVLNHALADSPAGQVRMHLCWGNYEGPHTHDIALEKVLAIVLKAKPMAIAFEAANPRHEHEWEVWREADLPEDEVLIPGLLDTTTTSSSTRGSSPSGSVGSPGSSGANG